MAVAPSGGAHAAGSGPAELPVTSLRRGWTPRATLRPEHVALLVASAGRWPPLLVDRSTMCVLDGYHRLEAAKQLGMATVPVELFVGTPEQAAVTAIERNVCHGLPLSLSERKAAAAAVLRSWPSWSDRRVAAVCGLSGGTVASLRARSGDGEAGPAREPEQQRTGRDGRQWRGREPDLRGRVAALVAENPRASLRAVAQLAGVSHETVRSVRKGATSGGTPPAPSPIAGPMVAPVTGGAPRPQGRGWASDSACAASEAGRAFASWFDSLDPGGRTTSAVVAAVPLSRIYEVIDEARRRAAVWEEFADRLADRTRTRSGSTGRRP